MQVCNFQKSKISCHLTNYSEDNNWRSDTLTNHNVLPIRADKRQHVERQRRLISELKDKCVLVAARVTVGHITEHVIHVVTMSCSTPTITWSPTPTFIHCTSANKLLRHIAHCFRIKTAKAFPAPSFGSAYLSRAQ